MPLARAAAAPPLATNALLRKLRRSASAIALVALHGRGVRQRCTEKSRGAAAHRDLAIVVLMSEKAVAATGLTILSSMHFADERSPEGPCGRSGVWVLRSTPLSVN